MTNLFGRKLAVVVGSICIATAMTILNIGGAMFVLWSQFVGGLLALFFAINYLSTKNKQPNVEEDKFLESKFLVAVGTITIASVMTWLGLAGANFSLWTFFVAGANVAYCSINYFESSNITPEQISQPSQTK